MGHSNIISTALKIHYLTNLNTYIIDQNQEFIFYNESISVPHFMPSNQKDDIIYFLDQMKQPKSQTYYFINDWDLYYLGHSFSEYTVILCPFLTLTPDIFNLTMKYNLYITT